MKALLCGATAEPIAMNIPDLRDRWYVPVQRRFSVAYSDDPVPMYTRHKVRVYQLRLNQSRQEPVIYDFVGYE